MILYDLLFIRMYRTYCILGKGMIQSAIAPFIGRIITRGWRYGVEERAREKARKTAIDIVRKGAPEPWAVRLESEARRHRESLLQRSRRSAGKVNGMKKRILIIEDNEHNLYLMTVILQKKGYEVVSARDGREGIALAGQAKPALILLDIQLPIMNGYDVARELRGNPALADVPIVAETAYAMAGDRERILAAGCTGYIEKPFKPDTFAAEIEWYLSHQVKEEAVHMITVLIADDNKQDQYMLKVLLEGHGYKVTSAPNGVEALKAARGNPPDIVFSDILMPVMDGFALCREWKRDKQLKKIPFVFYTAMYTDPRDEKLASELGSDKFIVRPIAPEKFIEQVKQVLEEHQQGKLVLSQKAPPREELFLMKYNEALVRKLEENVLQLEETNVGLVREISDHQRTEDALCDSEKLYRLLAENASDVIWATDMNLRTTYLSPSYTRMLGHSVEEGMTRGIQESLMPDSFAVATKVFAAAMDATKKAPGLVVNPREIVLRFQHKDGSTVWGHTTVSFIRDSDGHPVAITGVLRNITERKLAEDHLRSSELRYRRLFESAQDGILILDADTGRITDANPFLVNLLGYSRDDLLGKALWEISLFNDIASNEKAFQGLQGKGYIRHEHLPLETKDGRRISVESVSNVYLVDGSRVMQCNIRDVTERRKTEVELQKLASVVKHSREFITLTTLDRKLIFLNEAGRQMVGIEPEEVQQVDLLQVIPDHLQGKMRDELVPSLMERGTWEGDFQYRNLKTGKITDVHAMAFTVADPDSGAPLYLANVSLDITERKQAEQQLEESFQKLKRAMEATIKAIGLTVEKRDPYTAGHQRHVAQLACAIASEMGITGDQAESIRIAGLLHDLGKVQIPTEILSKPGPLTRAEFALIKAHPQGSYEILVAAQFPLPVADIVLQHHERIDGSGYPSSLRNGQILPEANILAVADVVEAVSSHRPYRPALGVDRAIDEISQNRGILYDPDVADACVRVIADKKFAFED